jgi:hypothetical protein
MGPDWSSAGTKQWWMNVGRTVFSQLIEYLPSKEFQKCVARYGGDSRFRGFSCWDQLLAMSFAQLMASHKRDTGIESKLPELFVKAEALASEIHVEHERDAAVRRREEIESHRRCELERRIERLIRNASLWRRAQRIRAYIQAVAAQLKAEGSIPPGSDAAKWLAWACRYADSIDPTCRPITIRQRRSGSKRPLFGCTTHPSEGKSVVTARPS